MAAKISVEFSSLEYYFNEIREIINEVAKAVEAAEKIGNLEFYKHGQAKKAVEILKDTTGKYDSLIQHYSSIAQLIDGTAEQLLIVEKEISGSFERINV